MTGRQGLPLAGVRVIEFTHMVMGPAAGLILADMGADVIKIEPVGGDSTRRLPGSGAGYFPMYNRNKRSICVDLKADDGRDLVLRLIEDADVVIENFRPGTMDRLGFGYEALRALHPRLIYCSEKGFPERAVREPHRAGRSGADDGRPGLHDRPARPAAAGRHLGHRCAGRHVRCGRHPCARCSSATPRGRARRLLHRCTRAPCSWWVSTWPSSRSPAKPAAPMPVRVSAWAIYQVFETGDGQQVFVGVVSDKQWKDFCACV